MKQRLPPNIIFQQHIHLGMNHLRTSNSLAPPKLSYYTTKVIGLRFSKSSSTYDRRALLKKIQNMPQQPEQSLSNKNMTTIDISSLTSFEDSIDPSSQEQAVCGGIAQFKLDDSTFHKSTTKIRNPSENISKVSTEMIASLKLAARSNSLQVVVENLMNEDTRAHINLAILALLPDLEQELSPQVLFHLSLEEFHFFLDLPVEIRLLIVSPSSLPVPSPPIVHFLTTKIPQITLPPSGPSSPPPHEQASNLTIPQSNGLLGSLLK
jgi:hypothetical protein